MYLFIKSNYKAPSSDNILNYFFLVLKIRLRYFRMQNTSRYKNEFLFLKHFFKCVHAHSGISHIFVYITYEEKWCKFLNMAHSFFRMLPYLTTFLSSEIHPLEDLWWFWIDTSHSVIKSGYKRRIFFFTFHLGKSELFFSFCEWNLVSEKDDTLGERSEWNSRTAIYPSRGGSRSGEIAMSLNCRLHQ